MYHANCMKPEQGNQRSWDTCHGRRACRRPSSLHPEVCVLHHVRLIKGTFGVQFPPQGNVVFCTKGRHTFWDWVIRGHGKLQCVLFITLKRVLRSCSVPIRRFFLMWCLAPYALGQSLPYSMDAVTLDAVALRHSRCLSGGGRIHVRDEVSLSLSLSFSLSLHAYTHTHTHTQTLNTHTNTHTHIHTHTHTRGSHICARAHTHTQAWLHTFTFSSDRKGFLPSHTFNTIFCLWPWLNGIRYRRAERKRCPDSLPVRECIHLVEPLQLLTRV